MRLDESHGLGDAFDVCVAKTTTSMKYDEARQMRKPIVTLDWLRASAKARRLIEMDRYKAPPLMGCVVSITGFTDLTVRSALQKRVEANGGIYSPDLVCDKCTHLIAAKPEGQKYEVAKTESERGKSLVKIVSEKWLDDCVRLGEKASEDRYQVVERVVAAPQEPKWVPPPLLEDDTPWDSHYLFGCRICLVGYDDYGPEDSQTKKNLMQKDAFEITKMVRLGAGILTKDLDRATHIVLSRNASFRAYHSVRMAKDRCLTDTWLYNCTAERKCLPSEDNLISEKVWEKVGKAMTQLRRNETSSVSLNSGGNRDVSEELVRENRVSRLNPAMAAPQQEVREPEVVTREQNPLARENLTRTCVPETHNTIGTELPATEVVRGDIQAESGDPGSINVPFIDKQMALSALLPEDEASTAREIISQGGGRVIDSRTGREFMTADFMVCPSMPGAEERRMLAKMAIGKTQLVTCFWLEECLHQGKIIDVMNSVAYRPLESDLPEMNDVHISTSQYDESVKRAIRYMCALVDAKYSDRLTRTQNTHLLTPIASGAKYKGASEWGHIITTVEWLENSIKIGKRLKESDFVPRSDPERHADSQAEPDQRTKSFPQVGRDLSALLQTSDANVLTPNSITKSTPSTDSRKRKSADLRGKTPLSRKSSGTTPGSKRLKTPNSRAKATEQLYNEVMEKMEEQEERQRLQPMPTEPISFPPPTLVAARNATGISSLQLTQQEKHETQVGYADFKRNSPRKSPRARLDGTDKLNTLFSTSTNATTTRSITSQGDNPSEWI